MQLGETEQYRLAARETRKVVIHWAVFSLNTFNK